MVAQALANAAGAGAQEMGGTNQSHGLSAPTSGLWNTNTMETQNQPSLAQ